jgi:D-alanyl-D-alanine carboxypeptidase
MSNTLKRPCFRLARTAFVLAVVGASANGQSNQLPYRPFPAVWQKALDEFSSNGSVPGAVIVIKSPEWGVRVGVTGYSNLTTNEKMTPALQFRVGSVSKTFTAQVLLQLEQEGRIKLTDYVPKYLSDNKQIMAIPNIERVTIHELLQMSSGITSYTAAAPVANSPTDTPHKQWTPNELMAFLDKDANPVMPPDYAPGEQYPNPYFCTSSSSIFLYPQCASPMTPWQAADAQSQAFPRWWYTNSNYIVLGLIVEKITGHPIQDEIKARITDKLGLKDTFFAVDGKFPDGMMRGYTKNPAYTDWHDVTDVNPSYAWSAGAVISTPWDLLRYLDAMLKNNELLNKGTKEKWMNFADAGIHWFNIQYGVGALMQAQRTYGTVRGHGGAYPGYKTLIYRFFDDDTDFILASNTWDGNQEVHMLDTIAPLAKSQCTEPVHAKVASGLVRLQWQAGRIYGDRYELYLGTDADRVDASSTSNEGVKVLSTPNLSIDVPGLSAGKTYYWRVDTISGDQRINGSLWSFRT